MPSKSPLCSHPRYLKQHVQLLAVEGERTFDQN